MQLAWKPEFAESTVWFGSIMEHEAEPEKCEPLRFDPENRWWKIQCDASTMFSAEMFRKFVAPFLREQCAYLDHSMYHLGGSEEFRHFDTLLEIEEPDAIGVRGVYVLGLFRNQAEVETVARQIESYR